MKKHYITIGLFLGSLFMFGAAHAQEKKWTLEQCINHAIEHNIQVKQVEIRSQVSQVQTSNAKGNFLPFVSGNAQHGWTISELNNPLGSSSSQTNQASSFGLGVSVDIYNGMLNQNQLAAARLDELSKSYDQQKIKQDIALHVINNYLQVLFNKEQVKTNQIQVDYDLSQQDRTQSLVDAGAVPAGDLLEAKATTAQSTQRLIFSQNELVMARLNLAQLLQLDQYASFDVVQEDFVVESNPILEQDPSVITERAFEYLTDIKNAQVKLDYAHKQVKIARSAYQPSLKGFYNLATNINYSDRVIGQSESGRSTVGFVEGTDTPVWAPAYQPVMGSSASFGSQFSDNLTSSVGFTLSVPIFQGNKTRNNVKISKLNLELQENEKQATRLALEQLVFKSYTDTQSAYQVYLASVATVESRKLSFDYAQERYSVGMISVFDLNQNQNLFVTAQSNLLRAKYDYLFKTRILEYYYGIPLF